VFPENINVSKFYIENEDKDELNQMIAWYNKFIIDMYVYFSQLITPVKLYLTADMQKYLDDFFTKLGNAHEGVISKYKRYVLRFTAIYYALIDWEYRENLDTYDKLQMALEYACKDIEYFYNNFIRICGIEYYNPVEMLDTPYKEAYYVMPTEFALKDLFEVAEQLNIKHNTLVNFVIKYLTNENKLHVKLFERVSYGKYRKFI
jgi:hypothetical protein